MMNSVGGFRAVVLGAMALCTVASLTGARAGQPASGLKVGAVDVNKLLGESKYAKTQLGGFQKRRALLVTMLQAAEQNPYLTEAEQKRLGEFNAKEAASGPLPEPEKKERDGLLEKSKNAIAENNALLGKPAGQFTQQDKDRFNEYDKRRNDTMRRLDTAQKVEMEKLQTQFGELNVAVGKRVREVIGKVAKDKGFNLILNNEVAFYADGDITEAAMAELNK